MVEHSLKILFKLNGVSTDDSIINACAEPRASPNRELHGAQGVCHVVREQQCTKGSPCTTLSETHKSVPSM